MTNLEEIRAKRTITNSADIDWDVVRRKLHDFFKSREQFTSAELAEVTGHYSSDRAVQYCQRHRIPIIVIGEKNIREHWYGIETEKARRRRESFEKTVEFQELRRECESGCPLFLERGKRA